MRGVAGAADPGMHPVGTAAEWPSVSEPPVAAVVARRPCVSGGSRAPFRSWWPPVGVEQEASATVSPVMWRDRGEAEASAQPARVPNSASPGDSTVMMATVGRVAAGARPPPEDDGHAGTPSRAVPETTRLPVPWVEVEGSGPGSRALSRIRSAGAAGEGAASPAGPGAGPTAASTRGSFGSAGTRREAEVQAPPRPTGPTRRARPTAVALPTVGRATEGRTRRPPNCAPRTAPGG